MNNTGIDWKRIGRFLRQQARVLSLPTEKIEAVLSDLQYIASRSGGITTTRPMLQRIGLCLLTGNSTVIAPACPDYSHKDGRYTFESLGGGVSLLTQRHSEFLKALCEKIPRLNVHILMADHEADNKELCHKVGKTRQEFTALVCDSVTATETAVASYGWRVSCMTDQIPTLIQDEMDYAGAIAANENLARRIDYETSQRADMYRQINPDITFEQMRLRTIHTAAQYLALGHWAAKKNFLVCNHTTTNLRWYLDTPVAILHNPVVIY